MPHVLWIKALGDATSALRRNRKSQIQDGSRQLLCQSDERIELFDKFVLKCHALDFPSLYVCVDEALVGFRGICAFKDYIPSKPD
jgi:hypothetical protein